MGYESYLRKRRVSVPVGTTNRSKNILYVSVVSLRLLVDVFSIHLHIFHWFIARLRADNSKVTAHERILYLY
jgi:hypothetical protein